MMIRAPVGANVATMSTLTDILREATTVGMMIMPNMESVLMMRIESMQNHRLGLAVTLEVAHILIVEIEKVTTTGQGITTKMSTDTHEIDLMQIGNTKIRTYHLIRVDMMQGMGVGTMITIGMLEITEMRKETIGVLGVIEMIVLHPMKILEDITVIPT
uniref:Uncharacterized protein n=1 Tax=Opuntia streptacantha TaxID=393608 RepID=A0A7C9ERG3_OPUST